MRLQSYLRDVRVLCQNHWWIPWIVLPTLLFTGGVYVSGSIMFGGRLAKLLSTWYLILGVLFLAVVLLVRLVWRSLTPDDPDYLTG